MHEELLLDLGVQGFPVVPGSMGENITTRGIALLALSEGTELQIGSEAVVSITGLRNPCAQLDSFSDGLMSAVLERAPDGELVRKAGVMAVVVASGMVFPGDAIRVVSTPASTRPLRPV